MGCDCKKTYNMSMGCCQPVLGPIENYYTKYQTELKIEEAISGLTGTTGCCITPEEVDEKISAATDGMATEQWVENQGYLTEHQHLKTINGESLVGDGNIVISGGTDLSNYYTTAQTVNLVESAVTMVEGEIPSLSGYATEQWVEDKHYITGVDLSDYALKSEIPTVPTSNTAFTNDAGYLTEHQPLKTINGETLVGEGNIEISGLTTGDVQTQIDNSTSGKVDTTEFTAYSASVDTVLSGKQDTLSAGTNITIVDNVISAQGGGQIAIDPTLDSGSTNAVANSAITDAVMVDSATTIDTTGYTRYYPSENEHATYETGSDNLVIYDYWKNRSHLYKATIELIDSEGNTISGSVSVGDGTVLTPSNIVPSALASYLTATIDSTSPFVIAYQTVDDYKISWANIYDYDDEWERYMDLSLKTVETVNETHTASDVIENYILPVLDGKQDKLSAGTNVSISNNVVSATDTQYTAGDGISISYQNVISTTTQFACVSEAEWSSISGNPQYNTVYLIY